MTREIVISDEQVPAEVMQAVIEGRKIVAVKQLREATGLGLANAKVVVDRLAMKHANSQSGATASLTASREVSSSPKLFVLTIALLATYWLWCQYFPS